MSNSLYGNSNKHYENDADGLCTTLKKPPETKNCENDADRPSTILEEPLKKNAEEVLQFKHLFQKDAKERLKQHYTTKWGASYTLTNQPSLKNENNIINHFDLIKLDEDFINDKIDDIEWEDFAKKQSRYKAIGFNHVFAQDQPLLLISGMAGIGKTYFLKNCILLWACGLLWNNVDFVFYIKFKSISNFQNISCLRVLINKFYGNILNGLEIPSQCSVTLVIDGLDKFTHFDKLIFYKYDNFSDLPLVNTLENIIRSNEAKCIISGRVETIATYWRACGNSSVTNILIRGLNCLGFRCYLEDNLPQTILKDQLNEIQSLSFEAKQILYVPLYLKAVCSTLLNSLVATVKTTTELMALVFYYFLKRKWKSCIDPLPQLIHSKHLFVLEVCKLAFVLLEKERRFVFKDELDPIPNSQSLGSDGFIELFNINLQYGFTHYIIMKFCASVYLYLNNNPQAATLNNKLHICQPIVSELYYGDEQSILSLICNIKNHTYQEQSSLQEIFVMEPKLKSLLINNLSSEWKKIAYNTGMSSIIIEFIDMNEESNKDKMEHFLTQLIKRNEHSYLTLLEKSLNKFENTQALCEIKLIFAKEQLKSYYITNFNSINQYSPKDSNNFINHFDLIKLNDGLENNMINDTEWEDFTKKRIRYIKTGFDKVFAQEQSLLLISGVAGVGKSYFLKKCLLLWAHGLLWNNVDFVFYLKFKSISNFQNIKCLDELLKVFYGNILKGLNMSSQCSVTLVIDGLEKFKFFDKLMFYKLYDFCNISLVNTIEYVFSSIETKCIIAGRVETVATYWRACSNKNVTNIQIMGLNSLGFRCYMESNLQHTFLKKQLNEIFSLSFDGKQILSVPLYLKAICSILSNSLVASVKTITELITIIFYYFLNRKSKSCDQLPQLIHSKHLYILKLCKLAFVLLGEETRFVSEDELDLIFDSKSVDSDSFIEILNNNVQYGFTHFIIMKFCASVYLYLYNCPQTALLNKGLHLCLPTVCGLYYGSERNILSLISNFRKPVYLEENWLQEIFDCKNRKLFIESLFESQTFIKNDLKMLMVVLNGWYNKSETDVLAQKYFLKRTIKLYRLLEVEDLEIRVAEIMTKLNEINEDLKEVHIKKVLHGSGNLLRREEHIKSTTLKESHLDEITKKFSFGRMLYDKKRFIDAENIFREAEILQNKTFGEKHINTISLKYYIGLCLYAKLEYHSAIDIFNHVYNLRYEILGEKHVDTIITKYYIGMCLYARLEYEGAAKIFSQVHQMRKQTIGEKHIDTISSKYYIGMCLYNKKSYFYAKKLLSKVHNEQKRYLGKNHLDTITTKFYVGMCLYNQEAYNKADKLFIEVHSMQDEILGKNHLDTIVTQYYVGMCLYKKKKYGEAEKLFIEVHRMQEEFLGKNHLDSITTKFYLCMCIYKKGDYGEAEKLFREVHNVRKEIFGEEDVDTISTKFNIGMCLYFNKEYRKALNILREVRNMQIIILGENHNDTLVTKNEIQNIIFHSALSFEGPRI